MSPTVAALRRLRSGRLPRRALLLGLVTCRPGQPPPYAGFVDAPVAAVASQVAGRVDAIAVREGDLVKKDQVLAKLDAREREAAVGQARASLDQAREALEEAEANLSASEPTVRGAGADIEQASATRDEAQTNYDRTKRLVQSGSAPDSDLVGATARLREASAHLQSLTAAKAATAGRVTATAVAVADSRAAVATAEAALGVAKVQLAEADVACPFDGLVVQRNLEPGEWAAPGTPVVTVEDLSRLWVRLDMGEDRVEGIHIGQAVDVRVLADPGTTLRGRVTQVGAEGDFAVNRDVKRGRPDLRTFLVRVALDEAPSSLRPGMTAEVSLPSPSSKPTGERRAAR